MPEKLTSHPNQNFERWQIVHSGSAASRGGTGGGHVREEPKKISAGKRKALANELKTLFKEIQSLPQAKKITEEEIRAEIEAYRSSR